jgi:transposase
MSVNNMYVYRSRISETKFRQLLKLFCLDLTATQITEITHFSLNYVNKYLKAIRHRIAQLCEAETPFSGQIEVDESYFGTCRAKGKRGGVAHGKTIVFGIFKRKENIYPK